MYRLFVGLLFYSLALILSFLDILHCIPSAVGVPVESALNPVSFTGPSGARATHFQVSSTALSKHHLLYLDKKSLMHVLDYFLRCNRDNINPSLMVATVN